jgi:hypothetical protein
MNERAEVLRICIAVIGWFCGSGGATGLLLAAICLAGAKFAAAGWLLFIGISLLVAWVGLSVYEEELEERINEANPKRKRRPAGTRSYYHD